MTSFRFYNNLCTNQYIINKYTLFVTVDWVLTINFTAFYAMLLVTCTWKIITIHNAMQYTTYKARVRRGEFTLEWNSM